MHEGGPVGPVVFRIGGGVNGENHIDLSLWLEEWPERNVLAVLATVD